MKTLSLRGKLTCRRLLFLTCGLLKLMHGAFHTDVYSKSTDAHQYLNFKSCHPPHVKKAIPYSQGLRLKRVCNSENAFEKRLEELKGFLVKRGYCSDYVDNQFGRVREVNRNSLFKRKEGAEHSNRNCFVVDCHPALRALYNIFRELHVIVSWSERFLRIMPEPPMVCFRRVKNLKDHLALFRANELIKGPTQMSPSIPRRLVLIVLHGISSIYYC